MPKPVKLVHPKQLLVEGRDAEAFFYPFLETMRMQDIEFTIMAVLQNCRHF